MTASPRPLPIPLPPVRKLIAAVLEAPRPTATQAHELARTAAALADEVERERKARGTAGAKGAPKTSADALLVQRAARAEGLTQRALADLVGTAPSILGRAERVPLPAWVREELRRRLGEAGGEGVG